MHFSHLLPHSYTHLCSGYLIDGTIKLSSSYIGGWLQDSSLPGWLHQGSPPTMGDLATSSFSPTGAFWHSMLILFGPQLYQRLTSSGSLSVAVDSMKIWERLVPWPISVTWKHPLAAAVKVTTRSVGTT